MLASFMAFHINAVSNIIYQFSTNLWLIIPFGCAVLTAFFMMKENIDVAAPHKMDVT